MNDIEMPVRKHTVDGKKRFWRLVPVATIAAAAVGVALIGGVAGPTNATAGQPARSVWVSGASGDDAKTAVSRYVTVGDGHFTFNAAEAVKAGISSEAVSAETSIVTGLNKQLAHDNGTTFSGTIDALESPASLTKEQAAAADSKSTTITLVPGFTITISSTGVVVAISKADVTEIENVAGFAKDLLAVFAAAGVAAAIATAIVAALNLPAAALTGPVVAAAIAFVGSVIGLAVDVLKICTAADGSATFTIPWFGIPSCSAQ